MSARAERATRLLLAGLLAVLALYVLLGDKPWALPGGPGFAAERGESLFITLKIALWWTSLVNLLLCAGLLATLRFWAAPLDVSPAVSPLKLGAGFLAGLVAAVALAGVLRFDLAHTGLFWDEAWTLKRAVLGRLEVPEDGGDAVFEEVPWRKTLWTFEKPTNHVLQSIASRLSLGAWQRLGGHGPHEFDELAFRFPSLLASLLAVPLMALLLAAWEWPRAGLAAAFLLALHPWHVEYGPAARGYGFVVLFGTLLALCLTRALQTASLRWCAGVSASLVLLFWSHAFSFYLVLSMGLAALPAVLGSRLAPADRLRLATRLGVAALLAAMFLLQVMGPNFAQVALWENVYETTGAALNPVALRNAFTLSTIGIPLRVTSEAPELWFPSVRAMLAEGGAAAFAIRWVFPLLLFAGGVAMLRRGGAALAVALGMLLGVPLASLGAAVLDHSFYPRFLIFGLLPAVALLPIGAEALLRALPWPDRVARVAVPCGLALALAGYAAIAWPQLSLLRAQPYSAMRELALDLGRRGPALRAGLGLGGDSPKIYDPSLRYFETAAELSALCDEARAEAEPLYVYYGYTSQNRRRRPDAFTLLDDRSLFEPVAFYGAIQPSFCYRLLRYSGGDCASAVPASATTRR